MTMYCKRRVRVLSLVLLAFLIACWGVEGMVLAQQATEAPPAAGGAPPAGSPTTPAAPGAPPAVPAPPLKIETGDTAWRVTSVALGLAMTAPGLGLLYAWMVREKHALWTIMRGVVLLCLVRV